MIHIENEDWDNVLFQILCLIPNEQRKEMIEKALVASEKHNYADRLVLSVGKNGKVTIFEDGKAIPLYA